jgi:hypothetical protein
VVTPGREWTGFRQPRLSNYSTRHGCVFVVSGGWITKQPCRCVAHSGHRRHRSAISNGNRLFPVETMDQRTHTATRFRDLVDHLIGDLGGKDRVSTGELQLIRRAATLSVVCESMEADAVANRPFNIEMFGMLCDRLGRCSGVWGSKGCRATSRLAIAALR